MAKYFYNYDELAHAWAHQTQQYGETYGGRMYFSDDTIYSYGSHFPIATMYGPENNNVILFNDGSYSSTTAKHQSCVRSAVSHRNIIYVEEPQVIAKLSNRMPEWKKSDWETKHMKNLDYFIQCICTAQDKLTRARKEHTKAGYQNEINRQIQAFKEYTRCFDLFGAPKKYKRLHDTLNAPLLAPMELSKARREALEKERKRRERRLRKLNKVAIAKAEENLKLWLKGEKMSSYSSNFHLLDKTYLRINGEDVETSRGARVPLNMAKILYKRLKVGKDIVGSNIGYYKVDRVLHNTKAVEKTFNNIECIMIGCHQIPMSEIRRVLDV